MPGLPEAVHVQLPDEGREVAVLEVLREDLVGELGDVFYAETITRGSPAYHCLDLWVLSKAKSTSIISSSLLMNNGAWLLFPFLLLLLFMANYKNYAVVKRRVSIIIFCKMRFDSLKTLACRCSKAAGRCCPSKGSVIATLPARSR